MSGKLPPTLLAPVSLIPTLYGNTKNPDRDSLYSAVTTNRPSKCGRNTKIHHCGKFSTKGTFQQWDYLFFAHERRLGGAWKTPKVIRRSNTHSGSSNGQITGTSTSKFRNSSKASLPQTHGSPKDKSSFIFPVAWKLRIIRRPIFRANLGEWTPPIELPQARPNHFIQQIVHDKSPLCV